MFFFALHLQVITYFYSEFVGLSNKVPKPHQIDGANSYDFLSGNIRQECLGLFDR
jgi:hypothetical protein